MDMEKFLARRESTPQEIVPSKPKSWDEIKRELENIKIARQKLVDDIDPMPWWEQRARQQLARLLPQLRDALAVEPMAKLSSEIRQLIFDLHNIMPEVLKGATKIDEYATQVEDLLEKIKEHPDDEDLVYQLDRLQNEEFEKNLNLPRNADLEDLIQTVQSADPNFRQTFRNEVIEQALRYLDLEGPKIKAARSMLIGYVNDQRRLKNMYSEVERHREDIDRLHTTAGYLIRGEELGIAVWNTAVGSLEQTVAVAGLVLDATESGRNFADPKMLERIRKLHTSAAEVEQRAFGMRSTDENGKALPEVVEGSFKEIV